MKNKKPSQRKIYREECDDYITTTVYGSDFEKEVYWVQKLFKIFEMISCFRTRNFSLNKN